MSNKFTLGLAVSSLLFASFACNSNPATDRTTSAPSPSREPISASAAPSMNAVPERAEAPLQLPADPAVIDDAQKTVTYLASDELEGRGVGTKGLDLAADYVAKRYAALGLQPLPGQKDYFQRFDYTTSITIGDQTALALNGKSIELRKQFTPIGFSTEGNFDAPIVATHER